MGGLNDIIRLGGNALSGEQYAALITGNNISNANTPGYHAQKVAFVESPYVSGLKTVTMARATNTYLESSFNAASSNASFSGARAQALTSLQASLGPIGEQGLNAALSDFFGSWRNLTASPSDLSVRTDASTKAQTLASQINQASYQIRQAQQYTDTEAVQNVSTINDTLQIIANLNVVVLSASSGNGTSAGLQDQRDQAVANMAQALGATANYDLNGQVSLYVDGVALVSGEVAYSIQASDAQANGMHQFVISGSTQGAIDKRITGGTLGAQLRVRDVDAANTLATLDQFAYDLSVAVNTVHQAGYGLDGVTGRALFVVPTQVANAAMNIAVNPAVLASTAALATGSTAQSGPEDNTGAQAMVAVQNQTVSLGNTQTLGVSLANMMSQMGEATMLAGLDNDAAQTQQNAAQLLLQQATGVSLQEQMLFLTQYQTAFQAAAKVITACDHMLATLQNM